MVEWTESGGALLSVFHSLTGACGLRILWIVTVFQWDRTLRILYLSYPVSWAITGAAHLLCFILVMRRQKRKGGGQASPAMG